MDILLVMTVSGMCGGIIGLIAGKLLTEREMADDDHDHSIDD